MLKNCLQANPAAPYVMPVVKSWPDEYVDPAMVNAFVETDPGFSRILPARPERGDRDIRPDAASGPIHGAADMGVQPAREVESKNYNQWANTPDLPFPMEYLFDTIPPDEPQSQRIITNSALGDIVNNVVMERKSGEYPFGETRYFIITPSA